MSEKKKTTSIRKLKPREIMEYYYRLSYPEQFGIDYVPVDMRMRAFSKLLAWQGIHEPAEAKDDKPQKMIFQIVTNAD